MDIDMNQRQEEREGVVGDAGNFSCEYGAMRNRVGDRMSHAGGDRSEKGGRDASRLILQFLVVIQKNSIEDISRTHAAMSGRNSSIVEDNGITQKIMIKIRSDLRSCSSKVTNSHWSD
jgi:hypothetical protein